MRRLVRIGVIALAAAACISNPLVSVLCAQEPEQEQEVNFAEAEKPGKGK